MSNWWCGLVPFGLVLLGFAVFALWSWATGNGVDARYPGPVRLHGGGQFSRWTYYTVAWSRLDSRPGGGGGCDPGQCPLSFHLADGEVTAADLADRDRLLARGWVRYHDPDLDPVEHLIYRQGDYHATATYHGGELVGVSAGPNSGEAARPDARGLDFVYQGRRVSLPAAEPELFRALGRPLERLLGAGG
jgi:hypothetical protein